MVVWVGLPFSQVVDKAALSSWFPHTLFGVSSVIHRSNPEQTPKKLHSCREGKGYLLRLWSCFWRAYFHGLNPSVAIR